MAEPRKIAFLSGLPFGGSTTFLCNLAGELARRGVPVIVISPDKENAFASDFQRAGVKVLQQDERHTIFEDRMAAMLRTLADFRPAVVIGCLGQSSYEPLRYLPPGVQRLAVIQSDAPIFYDAAALYAPFLDGIVGVSHTITAQLEGMEEFRKVTKLCLSYGVPMPETLEPRRIGSHPLRILYHGRLTNPQKRVRLFPRILEGLKRSGMPFHWTIAGEGEERNFLEANMKKTAANQTISFAGQVSYADVPSLIKEHDICLLASDCEGFGLGVLESMSYGLVPVVSDLPAGIPEMVDETTGILVPVDDVDGYARAIIHLHEHRDELAAKSAAAPERVKRKFSVAAMADRWLAALPGPFPTVAWPTRWNIRAPLRDRRPFYFSPPMRILRRLAAKCRR